MREKQEPEELEPARVLWGKFITLLRERNYPVLHSACGDITNVDLKGVDLFVKTFDASIYNILISNNEKINQLIKLVANVQVHFELLESRDNSELKKAQEKLGDLLKIK